MSSSFLLKNIEINIYINIILPVVLYGCETWSLTFRKKRRLRVFENRELMRTFGPMRDEVTGEWRKLRKEELYDMYSSPSSIPVIKSRRMRWAEHVASMMEERGEAYTDRALVGKPGGKRKLGKTRRRWKDNIKMNLQEVGWGIDWIHLAQDRDRWRAFVNAVMNLWLP